MPRMRLETGTCGQGHRCHNYDTTPSSTITGYLTHCLTACGLWQAKNETSKRLVVAVLLVSSGCLHFHFHFGLGRHRTKGSREYEMASPTAADETATANDIEMEFDDAEKSTEEFQWTAATIVQSIVVFCLAGCAEILGGWLVWAAVRGDSSTTEKKPWWYALLGSVVLVICEFYLFLVGLVSRS